MVEKNVEKNITNGFLKITNPQLHTLNYYNYDGSIDNFDFMNIIPTQYANFIKIQTLLNSVQIYFTTINIVKWNSQTGSGSPFRYKFIVGTTHPNLLWYKYDSEAPGSGFNLIYYKKNKIKTTIFINWTEQELLELLNK